ncbi:hypothetical protein HPB49_015136 [Dermacentor silvarum]|uniref:Uncharacterized protein n=1 Tax=Dermacentor silvarum TaxID=543639 RepID=A0ACB8CRQ8_DERSI|nr:hypothetical protein HPB49_015136 [Dermacentor silvarum]
MLINGSRDEISRSSTALSSGSGRKKELDDAVGFTIPPHGLVCSDHFRVSDYMQFGSLESRRRHRLRITAVPSIGLDNSGGTVLDDSVVQSGCVSVDVGANMDADTCCSTLHDPELKVWSSQPTTNGMPASNILRDGAILISGASAVKVLRLLASVRIEAFTTSTYNVYEKGCLVPAIRKTA